MALSALLKKPGRKKGRSGYSLVELAIVLGIATVVLGGIWVAANMVKQKARVQDAYETVKMIVDNMHSIGMGMPSMTGPFAGGDNADLSQKACDTHVLPQSVVRTCAPAVSTVNPWGGTIEVRHSAAGVDDAFRVYMYKVPADECIQLFRRFLNDADLLSVNTATGWVAPGAITMSSACAAGATNKTAGFEFTFRAQNP
jgi:hypothetical protein